MIIEPIAYIRTDFPEKFGIPRQSGLVDNLLATIVFEPKYRSVDALRGLEGFSHIWLIWEFSANKGSRVDWRPTVRPPRLGGNGHMGVFATRSPFRPNPLGLSCVRLEDIFETPEGPVINVSGADLMDGTPIYDIKPYIKYADSHPDAVCGYVDTLEENRLKVEIPDFCAEQIDAAGKMKAITEVLSLDPRPSYHDDPDRVYGLAFSGLNIRFKVSGDTLTVVDVS